MTTTKAAATDDPRTSAPWCVRCGVRHATEAPCPPGTQPTDPERAAWEGTFRGADGDVTVRILLAPVREGWRARILTAPRSLWVVPRTKMPMKFLGATAEEARGLATLFLYDALRNVGFDVEDGTMQPGDPEDRSIERRGGGEDDPGRDAFVRKLYRLSARWGVDRPERRSDTGNLSEHGMFLVTDDPLDPGTPICVRLEIGACSMPLRGRVVWNRPDPRDDLPPGMGIHLIRPPAMYRDFVGRLAP